MQHHKRMVWKARIHELQNQEEALEAQLHALEQKVLSLGQEALGELELEDGSENSVTTGVVPLSCSRG